MRLVHTLTSFLQPRKVQLIKLLTYKRLRDGGNLDLADSGTPEYNLRVLGLGVLEYGVRPEAGIVSMLEQYWKHEAFYRATIKGIPDGEDRAIEETKILNKQIAHIEFLLTGKPDAAKRLPEFHTITDYLRYRITLEYPRHDITPQNGYSDEFFAYSLQESQFFFAGSHD